MSDYPTSINLCDGKYTIIYDFATGQSECLRHGQPWRQLVGDKMVLACFDEIVRLSAELAKEREKVKELEDAYDQAGRTIQVQGRELIAAESRLHEVATHCANKEEQLAAAQLDAARYRWLRENLDNTEALEELYEYPGDIPTAEEFDAAIDNATKEEGK